MEKEKRTISFKATPHNNPTNHDQQNKQPNYYWQYHDCCRYSITFGLLGGKFNKSFIFIITVLGKRPLKDSVLCAFVKVSIQIFVAYEIKQKQKSKQKCVGSMMFLCVFALELIIWNTRSAIREPLPSFVKYILSFISLTLHFSLEQIVIKQIKIKLRESNYSNWYRVCSIQIVHFSSSFMYVMTSYQKVRLSWPWINFVYEILSHIQDKKLKKIY